MFPLENYLLLTPHEHDGVLLPAGALIALNKEQWHLLHTHDVVGDDPVVSCIRK